MSPETVAPRRSLTFAHDFRQLWIGDSISQLGTQISLVALPYLAVTILGASELQMGVLTTLEFIAFLLIGLPAGAWVDRWRRKRVLIANDLVRAMALATVPLAYAVDLLGFGQLCVVAVVAGTATVFFDVAYQSYLPSIVVRDQIVEGNAKLEASRSGALVAGPAVSGGLISLVGAPLLIAADGLSYLLSAVFIRRIRHEEPPHDRSTRRPLRTEIAEGLRFVLTHPLLSRITACTGLANLFASITTALVVLFMVRDLGLEAGVIGLVFSAGAIGGLAGAALAGPLARRVGEGRVIPLSALAFVPFSCLTPLAAYGAPVPLLIAEGLGGSFAVVVYNVNQVSFRQRVCPPSLLGRMNATIRFLVWGTIPIGALAGGLLGEGLSILTALWISAAGGLVATLPVLLSPLRRMRRLPDELAAP